MKNTILTWAARLIAAALMLQTLFFKFSASSESVYIFTKVGIEPWGRIATGIVELIASILILIPRTTLYGALLAIGIMGGAIMSHLFILGIEVQKDGGLLFVYATIILVCSLFLVFVYRKQLMQILQNRKILTL